MSSKKKLAADGPPMRPEMRPEMREFELLSRSGLSGKLTILPTVHVLGSHRPIGHTRRDIDGLEYLLDLLLPPGRACDAQVELEDVYDRLWLPKYGPRKARLVFAVQGAGIIWSFHRQGLTKWLGGAFGLMKLYDWHSGPRGG
jgi:hypothetical protein